MGADAAELPEWIRPDRSAAQSMQEQISGWLRRTIASGIVKNGERLPSEAVLMERLGVSRVTVRLAVDDLVTSGLLTRSHGRGTFVAGPPVRHDLSSEQGFFDALLSNAVEPEARLLFYDLVPAPSAIATLFGLPAATELPRIERLYMSTGRPVASTVGWLPIDATVLTQDQIRMRSTATIHTELLHRPVVASTVRIGAELAGRAIARLLAIKHQAPVLVLSRSRYDISGELRDFSRFTINPTAYELTFRTGR